MAFVHNDKTVFREKSFQIIKTLEALHAQIDNAGLPISATAYLADEAGGKPQKVHELGASLIQNGFSMGENQRSTFRLAHGRKVVVVIEQHFDNESVRLTIEPLLMEKVR